MVDSISKHHTIVLSTYILEELKRVTKRKFPGKEASLELFLRELPFELAYTPEHIDKTQYPSVRDEKDLPILVSAIVEDVDILITGDADFAILEVERPEILTPATFVYRYC
jgi:predicted nucleic acid-binding protein